MKCNHKINQIYSNKPLNLDVAAKSLKDILPDTMGVGFGIDSNIDDNWCLYVFTNDADTSMVPKNFMGFFVYIREIPIVKI